MADKVRIAHIGVDFPHAVGNLESFMLIPEVEIVALYDPHPTTARGLLPQGLGDRPLYDNVADLLAKERPAAVVITLPNDITPDVIVQAAEAGAHVFGDKPLARTAAEFRPAAEAILKAGVQLGLGYTRRSTAVGQAMKEIVDQDLLGRLVSVEASWITTSVGGRDPTHFRFDKGRSGGGMLHLLGCHWLDLIRWLTGAEVTEVAAILDTLSGESITVEDTAALSLRYSNGMIGSLHCAMVTDTESSQLYLGLRGTKGWMRWERGGPELVVRSTRSEWAAAPTRTFRFQQDAIGGYGGGAGLAARRHFIASIRDGAPSLFTADDALRVLEVLDAARESSRTGLRVALGST